VLITLSNSLSAIRCAWSVLRALTNSLRVLPVSQQVAIVTLNSLSFTFIRYNIPWKSRFVKRYFEKVIHNVRTRTIRGPRRAPLLSSVKARGVQTRPKHETSLVRSSLPILFREIRFYLGAKMHTQNKHHITITKGNNSIILISFFNRA